MSEEKKYVHPVNMEIPMDFWYAVEKQIVDVKINLLKGKKITKKDHIQELMELGYAEKEKQLKKANSEPRFTHTKADTNE